jgi:hypothetical protein
MNDVVIIDTNLLLLLIVGSASVSFIEKHKRLIGTYNKDDFSILGAIISEFSEIVSIPHVLAEVSNLARQIDDPARTLIMEKLKVFISTTLEFAIPSLNGVERNEYQSLGLTDSVLLHLCALSINGVTPTLITVDSALANAAISLGYSAIDFKQDFQTL